MEDLYLPMPMICKHKNLGYGKITDACLAMQASNPDPTSIFIEHAGEVIEVSKQLVTVIDPRRA